MHLRFTKTDKYPSSQVNRSLSDSLFNLHLKRILKKNEDELMMKLRSQKSERQNSWHQAKHATVHSEILMHTYNNAPFWRIQAHLQRSYIPGYSCTHQRQNLWSDFNFCVRKTPPRDGDSNRKKMKLNKLRRQKIER